MIEPPFECGLRMTMGVGSGLDLAGLKREGLNVDGTAGLEALSCKELD